MAKHLYTSTGAILSPDGLYRYELSRTRAVPERRRPKTVTFIMLNPSTADANEDDPTIRRCVSFAKHLKEIHWDKDIIGPDYWEHLRDTINGMHKNGLIILGWGAHGDLIAQGEAVLAHLQVFRRPLFCLGITASGFPKHPLYLADNTKLRIFTGEVI